MGDQQDRINQLLDRLESLIKRQDDFSKEINSLRLEIHRLKTPEPDPSPEVPEAKPETSPSIPAFEANTEEEIADLAHFLNYTKGAAPKPVFSPTPHIPKIKSDFEKFIGENLINKIGIAITVLGVGIGAKYAIDHELISPLTRIILGYLFGTGLLGFAIRLKSKYENFSAVLLSGAMAILYFITFAAYSFYGLFPQGLAFALMVVFTAFTVVAAIKYNMQVIAHFGLVGAYAVPFLLSEDPGRVEILFSYMAIINLGILAISFSKYWKALFYVSFGLTWLIFFLWYLNEFEPESHFGISMGFLFVFFTIFYVTFLANKLIQKEKFEIDGIILLLANSFIFYGLGYATLEGQETGGQLLGLFTLCNAIVHFVVGLVIYRQKLADRNLFYFVSGLVLVFITIAIPVQLEGNWVTLLWAAEAALLFWIGRTKGVAVYENLSYPLMLLAFFSICEDWTSVYNRYSPEYPDARLRPLINVNFLSSVLFVGAFLFINFLNRNEKYASETESKRRFSNILSLFIPAILLVTIYYAFRMEIANYWNQLFSDSALTANSAEDQFPLSHWNYDLPRFKTVWVINYSLLFASVLSFVNIFKFKSRQLGYVNLGLIVVTLAVFLVQGLYVLSDLRESYLDQSLAEFYHRSMFNLGIRYVSFGLVALSLFACYRYLGQDFMNWNFKIGFEFMLHIAVVWIASAELIHWLDIAGSAQSYKLGLSILWGVYSLFLIALGIWKKNKPLRIGAIGLFGITLVKLFFYDISHLDTIGKTIVFVSLGVLLLIISFLYNKYKHIISDGTEQ